MISRNPQLLVLLSSSKSTLTPTAPFPAQELLTRLLSHALSEVGLMASAGKFEHAGAIVNLFEVLVVPRTQAEALTALESLRQRAERLSMSNWLHATLCRVMEEVTER